MTSDLHLSSPSDVSLPELLHERDELLAQIRLAETARRVVRRASGQRSLDFVLAESRSVLLGGFRALGMWLQTFDEDGLGKASIYSDDGRPIVLSETVHAIAYNAAHALWSAQETLVLDAVVLNEVVLNEEVHEQTGDPALLSAAETRDVATLLADLEVGSILFVPLGAGHECLGNLVLTRAVGAVAWTQTEAAAALDVGRDLGAAILNVRAYEREHRLVQQLQALDTYKSQLIATVSHELKNPLTSVLGHLEILESVDTLPAPAMRSVHAMERGARRLGRVVDDLLLLGRVGDPSNPVVGRPVDLRAIVDDVVELTAIEAERRHQTVTVLPAPAHERAASPPDDVPTQNGRKGIDAQMLAQGDPDELDRVVSNLVSNAMKYTPEGGRIDIQLCHRSDGGRAGNGDTDEIELIVRDNGFGISAEDQEQLFTEFFRSSNPAAVAQPGTGLGLAIVHRIVKRHCGHIALDSTLGSGSTFRIVLPAA